MDKLANFLSDLLDAFNRIPGHQWYVWGTIAAGIPATILIMQWAKRHHVKRTAEDLATHFILLGNAFTGFLMTVAAYIITNGPHLATLAPFLGHYAGWIIAGAPTVYSVSKAIHDYLQRTKDTKAFTNPNHLDTLTAMATENRSTVSVQAETKVGSSLGTEATGNNLLQL